ncbi:MAG: putative maltokinase, partial [Deltaproteobacteria bacterium]|nr:putative maltokinase [Deltaproteobacteria bacterium]
SAIGRRRRIKGGAGGAVAWPEKGFRQLRGPGDLSLEPVLLKGEQSNTSIVYGNRLILKLFRRLDLGPNPDLEIGRFLTRKGFPHVPPVAGALEYLPEKGESITLGVLHGFVPNQGDAWTYTLDILKNSFEQALAQREKLEQMELPDDSHLPLAHPELPPLAQEWIGPYLESARLLGQRTAELQLALSGPTEDPSFIPEPFSQLYQRSYYQSLRNLNAQVLRHLRRRIADLPEAVRPEAQRVLDLEGAILNRFRWIREVKLPGLRIRCHGDYHLGQVLYTGKEFIIMDFEGEPDRPLGERRIKRSPLRDVAGMLRSFHYAAYAALFAQMESGLIRPELFPLLEKLPPFWSFWVGVVFLREYLERMGPSPLLPRSREEIQSFLHVLLLEKAVYELGYELNHRPGWVQIPLAGIRRLLPDERREGG